MGNTYAMDLANTLHDEGLSDGKLGELLGVTREYVNKIRSGKKVASAALTAKLESFFEEATEAPSASYEYGYEEGTSSGVEPMPLWLKCFLWGIGLVFLCCLCGAWYYSSKHPVNIVTPEEKQKDNNVTDNDTTM